MTNLEADKLLKRVFLGKDREKTTKVTYATYERKKGDNEGLWVGENRNPLRDRAVENRRKNKG